MKITLKILFFLILSAASFAQTYNWITPNKTYLKCYVSEDAIYRMTRNDFVQAGINTSGIDPRTVKVLYKGSEIPAHFEGEDDGSFDDGDFLDFYGTRNYGGPTNTYHDVNGTNVVDYITDEYFNLYSDTSVYWIGWDGNPGMRFTPSSYSVQNPYTQGFYYERSHLEKDSVYSLGETINANSDYRYFNTEKVSGEGWFWKNLTSQGGQFEQSTAFLSPDLYNSPQTCFMKIFAYPNSQDTSTTSEHKLNVYINGTNIAAFVRNNYDRIDTTITFSSSVLSASSVNQVRVQYAPAFINQQVTPSLYFDMLDVKYPRTIKLVNGSSSFRTEGTDTSSALFKLTGFNINAPVFIYDIKNNTKINIFGSESDTLLFTGKQNGSFEVRNQNITKKPQRFESRQVSDLISASNAAQYLLIYNSMFTLQAEDLRSYRQAHDNFIAKKVDVTDIIDVFNYGMEDPIAIRRFTDYVMRFWQGSTLRYICLFGRGSLDPKHNVADYQYYRNLVPVYGNPVSDGYFANNNFGGFTYFKKVAIGRIPAYTVSEAQNIVNKIIAYDNEPLQNWTKVFSMITGGKNRSEQIYNQNSSEYLISNYISPPPVVGDPHRIYRNDSSGYITFNYKDSIIREINRGSVIVNFIGHAASQDWELGLEDPGVLTNAARLPLVLSMTCFTGRSSEPDKRGFGERFLYNPGGGCVGFIGTTGWSFTGAGNVINQQMLKSFSQDSVRRSGDLLERASQYLGQDSLTFYSRNMVNSYDLQGDPATKLLLPAFPEFEISQSEYRISNPYPIVGEPVSLVIYPKNYGTFAPNCLARFEILRNGLPISRKDTLLTNFGFYDTAAYFFKIDTLGNYAIKVSLDPDNVYPEPIESNNIIIIPLPLRNISYTPLKPIYNSAITRDSVEFVGLNPQVDLTRNNVRVILQVDTSRSFVNPVFTSVQSGISGVATRIKYRIPFSDTNLVYFWRTNSVVNNDSAGWSATMRFVYSPSSSLSRSKQQEKYSSSKGAAEGDSIISIYQRLPGQFEQSEMQNLFYNGSGYELKNFTGNIQVKSHGNSGSEASYFQSPVFNFFIDGGHFPGLNISKVSRLTGGQLEFRNFSMMTSSSSDSVLNYLNTFDTSQYLLTAISSAVGPDFPLNTNTKNKFREFGSILVDSVTSFGAFYTWAFIGTLGSQPVAGAEAFNRPNASCPDGYCPSFANYTATFLNTHGEINFSMGPAHRWKYFSWVESLQPNSNILFDVTGVNRLGTSVPLLTNLAFNSLVNLDTLNSFTYPSLKLRAKISIDTVLGYRSPVFNSFNLRYTPPAEIIPDNYSFIKSDSVVTEGTDVTFSVKTYNVGFVPANAVIFKWTSTSTGGFNILKTDTVYIPLRVDSMRTSSVTFNTQGLRDPAKLADTLSIGFEAEILGTQNDYFYFNNFAFSKLVVKGDTTRPYHEITFDGLKIINGDPISSNPEILYKFYDYTQNTYTISDTSKIFLKQRKNNDPNAQAIRIPYSSNGQPNPDIVFNPVNNGNLKVEVIYKPHLDEGNYDFYFIGENQNNIKDTAIYNANVTNNLSVKYLYNYPNPMRDNTYFTFMLFAPGAVQNCRLKIYTVAGRLIKEITAPAKVGFNQIYWDGRDADGDNIANGIYFYKLIVEDAGKTESSIQKLAVLK